MEFYHPECCRKILITDMRFRRNPNQTYHLYIEGICRACDKYVQLMVQPGGPHDRRGS